VYIGPHWLGIGKFIARLSGLLEKCQGGQVIVKWVHQEWGVGSELKLEGQGLTQVLLHVLLGGKEDRTIGARDLNLGHTAHW